jgi:C-terminal processing protease CtpA/Prc
MAPYADAQTKPFRKNRTGLALVVEAGHLVVDFVSKDSPAERGGWKPGDRVTAIDGRPIPADYAVSEASLWVFGPAGRTVTLTDGGGRQKKLTLADYY